MKQLIYQLLIITAVSTVLYSCEPSVAIGKQTWMSQNLTVTNYRNGDPIPEVEDRQQWANLTTGAWCYYRGDVSNETNYQKLYNYYALTDPRGLAPKDWHIPSDAEWEILSAFLGGDNVAGAALKESGTVHWKSPNTGTNSSGFNAKPGGYRDFNGTFYDFGDGGYWWSLVTSGPWFRTLNNSVNYFNGSVINKPNAGFSVRCVHD